MYHDPTIQLISLALDASLMRQTAIANNIANANTRNYQTIEVNFEQQFNHSFQTLEPIKPFYELSDIHSGLDEQMALNIKNSTQYRALIKGLNHKIGIMKLALQGNYSS